MFSKAEQLLFLYVATYNNKVTWTDGQCIVHILFSNTTFLFYITFLQVAFYVALLLQKLKKTSYQIYILLEEGANRTVCAVWTVAIRPSKCCIICSYIKNFH